MDNKLRIAVAGLSGGFLGNGVLGALFSLPFIKSVLYNPSIQSQTFIAVTPLRNIPVSVMGLIILSVLHAYFYSAFKNSIPGTTWLKKGLFWGFTIWAMFWLFQEWFVYHTLLGEPYILNILELVILFIGSAIEGIVIAYLLRK